MNNKQAKKVRKQVNNYLNNTMENNSQVQFAFKQLETYIQLSMFLTGKKPEKIELVGRYYDWYVQECQHQAEALGLNQGFKEDKVTFLGIPLEKKVEIAVAK